MTGDSETEIFLSTEIFQAACGKDGTSDERTGLVKSTHSFPSSEHRKYNIHGYKTVAIKLKKERPYHKTIAVVLPSFLLQIGEDECPHPNTISHDVNEIGHDKAAAYDGFFHCRPRNHPIATLYPLQPVHNELRHRVGVWSPEDT